MKWNPPKPTLVSMDFYKNLDKRWTMEMKMNGIRCLWIDRQFFTRTGNCLTIPVFLPQDMEIELDGEWIKKEEKYYVFDILRLGQVDLCHLPYASRRKILEQEYEKFKTDNVFLIPKSDDNWGVFIEQAKSVPYCEGVVLKNKFSLYPKKYGDNHTYHWLKIKWK